MSFAIAGHSQDVRLSPPRASTGMAMVSRDKPAALTYDFRMQGSEIRYTTDGSQPSQKSKKYRKSIRISKPCTVKARAFHPDFKVSAVAESVFVSRGHTFSILSATQPDTRYVAGGVSMLSDGLFGDTDFRQHYLGYDMGPVEIIINPDPKKEVSLVNIACMIRQGAWIFGPQSIRVYDGLGRQVGEELIHDASVSTDPCHRVIAIKIQAERYSSLKIVVEPLSRIPDWHDGRGQPAWFFIDEIWIE